MSLCDGLTVNTQKSLPPGEREAPASRMHPVHGGAAGPLGLRRGWTASSPGGRPAGQPRCGLRGGVFTEWSPLSSSTRRAGLGYTNDALDGCSSTEWTSVIPTRGWKQGAT